jgi:hypothetical protein
LSLGLLHGDPPPFLTMSMALERPANPQIGRRREDAVCEANEEPFGIRGPAVVVTRHYRTP